MGRFVAGADRNQTTLFPDCLDDWIDDDNPVRVVDGFVDALELGGLGFDGVVPEATGRPSYHPAVLLKLYIYGYLNRVQSSRRLEREAGRNVELMWLTGRLVPDHKTIADFRKDNGRAIRGVCARFVALCREMGLLSGASVAIDGSKFKAVTNRRRNFNQKKLERAIGEIDKKIDSYLNELDEADEQEREVPQPTAEELREKIEHLKERKGKYRRLEKELQESGEKQISLTDPESRMMPVGQATDVCYNVQVAVDAKHKLIVEHEVTNDVTDQSHLSEMARRAKETLQVEGMEVVADMGYFDGEEVKKCVENGITPYVAKPSTSANRKRGLFTKEQFTYDRERDCYICPQGADLNYRFETVEAGRHIRYYATARCRDCPLKPRCTGNKNGRRITRWVDEHLLEEMAERVKANREMMKQRQQIVEHPFGTLKRAAPIRDDEASNDEWILSDARVEESRGGDESDGTLIQHQAGSEYPRS